jgi:hypothetical protein
MMVMMMMMMMRMAVRLSSEVSGPHHKHAGYQSHCAKQDQQFL